MPNHCENDLLLVDYDRTPGKPSEIDALLALMGPDFDFDALLPVPADQPEHEWRCEHWGTKWSAYEVTIERVHERRVVVRFQTAWAPPEGIFRALCARFPTLSLCLEYYECGVGFCGGMRRDSDPDDDDPETEIKLWHGDYFGMRGG